ncbi:MAG: hypothetical protein Fur0034_04400 [Desulfuromonadia bacterium]
MVSESDQEKQTSTVINTSNRVVEYRTYERFCHADAISFPDSDEFNGFIKYEIAEN